VARVSAGKVVQVRLVEKRSAVQEVKTGSEEKKKAARSESERQGHLDERDQRGEGGVKRGAKTWG